MVNSKFMNLINSVNGRKHRFNVGDIVKIQRGAFAGDYAEIISIAEDEEDDPRYNLRISAERSMGDYNLEKVSESELIRDATDKLKKLAQRAMIAGSSRML